MWDKLGDTVCEITKPKDLDSIIRAMIEKEEKTLRKKLVWPMRYWARIDQPLSSPAMLASP